MSSTTHYGAPRCPVCGSEMIRMYGEVYRCMGCYRRWSVCTNGGEIVLVKLCSEKR